MPDEFEFNECPIGCSRAENDNQGNGDGGGGGGDEDNKQSTIRLNGHTNAHNTGHLNRSHAPDWTERPSSN